MRDVHSLELAGINILCFLQQQPNVMLSLLMVLMNVLTSSSVMFFLGMYTKMVLDC